MKRLLKWFGLTLLAIVFILLCLLAATYFLLGTERGFKLATEQLSQRVEGLELGAISGNLKSGINSDQLSFNNDQINVDAKGLTSQWQSGCVFRKAVCVDKIIIDELNIETFDTGEVKAKTPGDIVLPEVELPISFNADEVLIKTLRFQAPNNAPVQELKNITLSAYSEGNKLQIDKVSAQYDNITVAGKGNITPTGDYPLALSLQIDAIDFLEEHDAMVDITLGNTLADLDVDVQVSGAVNATIHGDVKPLKQKLPATLELNIDEAGWPLESYDIAKAEALSVKIDGDLNDYQVALNGRVSGEQIPDTTLNVQATANTERALVNALTADTLDGQINAKAAVTWLDGTTFISDWDIKNINPAVKYDGVDGKLDATIAVNGELVDGKTTLDLQKALIKGTLRDLPFELDTQLVKFADDSWELKKLVLNNGRNQVNAAGRITDLWDMKADIKLPDLENLLPGLLGGFNAKIDLKGELKNPDGTISAASKTIQYNDITISGLALDADIAKGALEDSNLNLGIDQVQAGVQDIRNTKLSLNGTRALHALTFFADGPEKTSVDLLATGGLSDSFDWNGLLAKVKLEVPAHEINLRDKTKLSWNNKRQKFSIDAHCWSIQETNLCLENQVLAQDVGQAKVTIDAYRLEQLNPFLPADSTLNGILTTDVVVDWGEAFAGGYAIQLNAGVNGGKIKVVDPSGPSVNFVYDTLTLSTNADANAVDSTLTIDSQTMGQARVALSLDPSTEQKNIDGKVELSGFKLDFLKAFLPNFDAISGSVSAKGDLSGELLDPLFDGDVVVSGLMAKSDDLPLSIDGGDITTTINGKRARINGELKSGEGNVKVSGTANWLNDTWRADIKINSEQLKIVQEPLTDSSINTALVISARPDRIRVRGNIEVPKAQIDIKELPRGATNLSEDIIVVEDVYAETLKNRGKKQQQDSELDVAVFVSLGDDVSLSGYGLNATLTGKMSVTLNSPNPVQLGGEIRIVKGIYKQYGQDLEITDGQILFVGPIDKTSLDIDAVRTVEDGDRVAGLHIDGRVENPEITLFTEPADKPQESILSYIVLGRDLRDATDQEANLLASAALALTLRGGKAVSSRVADTLGIQEISLDARGRGDTTEVVVSGRINDRLLLRYGRSVFDDTFTLYLRYDLTKKLYLEAAQGAARAVDLFYSFSF